MIFVNLKTYAEGSGQRALDLVRTLEEVATASQIKVIPVVQALDLKEAALVSKLEIWTQRIDPVAYGAHTGSILPEGVVEDGAKGTFLNHSEEKFADFEKLSSAVERAHEVGLKTLVFASDMEELKRVLGLKPTFVAYEPPEFIGSTTTSVAEAAPEVIAQAVEVARMAGVPLVVGAGIHSMADVKKSIELGAVGIAVATDIVKAADPKKELLDLMEGFK